MDVVDKRSRPIDPKGPPEVLLSDMPLRRVVRGPSWRSADPFNLRITARRNGKPQNLKENGRDGYVLIGFRVVADYMPPR